MMGRMANAGAIVAEAASVQLGTRLSDERPMSALPMQAATSRCVVNQLTGSLPAVSPARERSGGLRLRRLRVVDVMRDQSKKCTSAQPLSLNGLADSSSTRGLVENIGRTLRLVSRYWRAKRLS